MTTSIEQLNLPAGLKPAAAQVCSGLPRLAEYYRGLPAETARFTRDQSLLKEVARLTTERLAKIEALADSLNQLR